ncbi:MAG: efflux RND transporter periplasmic adaptor subunit, partial [Pseudomonadota bacterium]
RVDIEVDNSDLSIRDGQTAEIGIQADGEVAHLLPQSALTLDNDGRLGVRLVEDNAAAFAPVSVLRDTTEGIWVAGLDEQAEVIVVGQEFVTDGVRVDVTFRETEQ